MSRSLNKVTLIGNLGADPEIRTTPNGSKVAQFSLATGRQWTSASGEKQEKTEWHKCVAWNGKGRGTGLAVEGLASVTVALRDGSVDTLIIGDLGDAAIVDDGGEQRADEALPLLAVATHAALIRTDERINPADGVGAVLRYADPNVG